MMKKIKEKPSNRKVDTFCDSCKEQSYSFMTNQEIFANTNIQQWCDNCQEITIWSIK